MAEGQFSQSATPKTVSVRFGVYQEKLPVVGKTVAQVRAEMGPRWSMSNDAQAYSGKTVLADDHVIQPGDTIEFQRRTGEKG